MSGPSPLLSRALADARDAPPGLLAFLTRTERDLRAAAERLQAVSSPVLPLLGELRTELTRALDDAERGALPRVLRRPLWQLDSQSPAIRAFGTYARGLLDRVEPALLLQTRADRAAAKLASLRQRFGERLPTLTTRLLREAGVAEEDLGRARKPADVEVFEARLERVADRLAELAADLPSPPAPGPTIADGEPTVEELWALLRARMRVRERATAPPSTAAHARQEAARHVQRLTQAAAAEAAEPRSSELSLEQLAGTALREPRSVPAGLELPMWTGLVAAAAAAAYRKDREGWIPRLPARASEPDPLRSPSTLFVVPIEGAWAWITRDTPSPVRLRALAAEPGRKVAAQVFAADREEVAFRVAELDVVPLFAGASEAVPAWYVTELPARLRVEASFRDGWFARVMERGAVRRLETPAWSEQMGEPGAIRLLPPPDRLDGAKGIEVGPTGLEASEFLGLKTLVVRAPFHHDPTAWLRTGSGTVAAEEAIERERELFARLERRSGARGLRYVSRASLAGTAEYGVLYAAPFGLRAESSPPLADWVRERPLAFIRAVAAAMLAAHEAGFVLGLCHLSMFAFSAGFGGRDAEPRPHAVLCCAPYATPAGHYFPADTGSRGFASFPSLGYQALLPWLTGAEAALPDIDALAFALFALDLLPRRASSTPLRSWSDLVAFSGTAAESYQRPELAARLAAPLHDRSQAGAVLDFMRALAHPTRA